MAAGIYRLFCAVSGKSYVGQSMNVARRVEGHFKGLHEGRHPNTHLQRSFNLHGHDAFLAEVLEYCDQEVLTEREQHWMDYYGFENLYNICPAAGSTAGYKFNLSDEQRQRLSEATKGKKRQALSEEARQRIGEANKASLVGNKNGVGNKGRKHTDETRKRISEAQKGNQYAKGKKYSGETRKRMSEAQKGKPKSDETRQRMAEAQKARHARQRAEKEATQ